MPLLGYSDPQVTQFGDALKSGLTYDEYQNQLNQGNEPLVVDTGNKEIDDMAARLNVKLTDETKDYLMQYYLNEQSNQAAWNRQMEASNTQYQRAVKDLQAAGLNPFLALQSLSGSSPTSSGMAVSGGHYTSKSNNNQNNGVKAGVGVLAILATIVAAAMRTAGSAAMTGA